MSCAVEVVEAVEGLIEEDRCIQYMQPLKISDVPCVYVDYQSAYLLEWRQKKDFFESQTLLRLEILTYILYILVGILRTQPPYSFVWVFVCVMPVVLLFFVRLNRLIINYYGPEGVRTFLVQLIPVIIDHYLFGLYCIRLNRA